MLKFRKVETSLKNYKIYERTPLSSASLLEFVQNYKDYVIYQMISIIVCPRKIGVCVWVQILKRVVVRLFWNFYTIIWHLFTFSFAHWKNFSGHQRFFRSGIKKKWITFFNFLKMVNLNEIFYVMKVVGKILRGVFLIGRIVNFHFHPILEFSD